MLLTNGMSKELSTISTNSATNHCDFISADFLVSDEIIHPAGKAEGVHRQIKPAGFSALSSMSQRKVNLATVMYMRSETDFLPAKTSDET